MRIDSDEYKQKKRFFHKVLTIFGRKPVLEALQDPSLTIYRLHLAESNRSGEIMERITQAAQQRNIDICYHNRQALSRISKNAKQDQGVALDIHCEQILDLDTFVASAPPSFELIALDCITNPQNLGMIIRSVCASPITGLLLPDKGCAKLDALVIKASAGTLFKAPLIRCPNLSAALKQLQEMNSKVYALDLNASRGIGELDACERNVFVLGNETDGISNAIVNQCTDAVKIPMANGVESLNVAVTASLLAFRSIL